MPRSKGMKNELRMLSPDVSSFADRDSKHRKKKSRAVPSQRQPSPTNLSLGVGSNHACDATRNASRVIQELEVEDILLRDDDLSSVSSSNPDIEADSDSDTEDEESDETPTLQTESTSEEDVDDDSNKENDEPPPFVTPPPPMGKGKTSFVTEVPQNLILPMDVMTYFVEEQMVCPNAECYSKDEGTAIEHPLRLEHCQYGFASEVYVRCPCCGWAYAISPPKSQIKEDPTNGTPTKKKQDRDSEQFHKYALNYNAALIMQKLGFGMRGLGLMMAMLGIQNSTGSNWKWNRLVDRVGLALNEVAEEVFIENQQKEKKATEDKAQDEVPI